MRLSSPSSPAKTTLKLQSPSAAAWRRARGSGDQNSPEFLVAAVVRRSCCRFTTSSPAVTTTLNEIISSNGVNGRREQKSIPLQADIYVACTSVSSLSLCTSGKTSSRPFLSDELFPWFDLRPSVSCLQIPCGCSETLPLVGGSTYRWLRQRCEGGKIRGWDQSFHLSPMFDVLAETFSQLHSQNIGSGHDTYSISTELMTVAGTGYT
nr:hypothetical protein Itr_chr05CG13160 [Ipomoea trifida]